MTIEVIGKDLIAAIKLAQKAAPKRGTWPALECVRLTTEPNLSWLHVQATNGESYLQTVCTAIGEENLDVLVNPQAFLPLLDKGRIAIEVKAGRISTRNGSVVTGRVADFPPFPVVEEGTLFELPADALHHIAPAVSRDTTRPVLECISVDKGQIAACDGYRLGMVTVPNMPEEAQVIFPARVVNLFPKAGSIAVFAGPKHTTFTTPDATITVVNFIGTYPNYRSLVPTTQLVYMDIDASELFDALTLLAPVAKETGIVRFTLNEGGLRIQAGNEERGGAERTIGVSNVTGSEADISGFRFAGNVEYMKATAKGIKGTVRLGWHGTSLPITLRHSVATWVVMPAFVQW